MITTPEIREIAYSREELDRFVEDLRLEEVDDPASNAKYLLDYPTVYIVHDEVSDKYQIYIGETTNIRDRTIQHLNADPKTRDDWRHFSESTTVKMFVIGHPYFNKSLTLDVENRLMHYFTGAENVTEIHNRRTNAQNLYYTQEHFDRVFSQIWRGLRKKNKKLFPTESIIKDSALFKASPFHKLTEEQLDAKREIYTTIQRNLARAGSGHLTLLEGEAGAGKTVLLSSVFYELFQASDNDDDPFAFQDLDAYLLVNHDEQLTVYREIAKKLGLLRKGEQRVSKPTTFINNRSPDNPVDVILIDEAHLLWTQGKQSYRGDNQLVDLLDRAKVVIAVFDENQILRTNQFWEPEALEEIEKRQPERIRLKRQMRMDAADTTVEWVRGIVDDQTIGMLDVDEEGKDARGFEVRVYDDAKAMHADVASKSSDVEKGLSRVLATFDWKYSSKNKGETYYVSAGNLTLPWNKELESNLSRKERRKNRNKAWAEQAHTINEAGSTFTIQGFDLNYAGVIIGPSVKYREGRVIFDPSSSANSGATQKRTMRDGKKVSVAEVLIRNELNVLLTRGVHGLYIYAVDDELREALKTATTALP